MKLQDLGVLTAPFSQAMAAKRKEMRHSYTTLSDETGISRCHLHQLEHGVSFNPTIKTITAVGKALKITAHKLAALAILQIQMEEN